MSPTPTSVGPVELSAELEATAVPARAYRTALRRPYVRTSMAGVRPASARDVLRGASLLRCVSPAAADALFEEFEIVDLAPGGVLFEEGRPCDALYIVLRGKVMFGRRAGGGSRAPIGVMGPLDQFGEESLFERVQTATATSITGGQVARLPKAVLMKVSRTRPQVARHLLESLARRLCDAESRMVALTTVTVRSRVAGLLLELTQRFGSGDPEPVYVAHGLTQQELACLVGATRETVNRVLADFSARGWIVATIGGVDILDRASLVDEATKTL